ncbi:T9SS type A sorting domain-containing protein [Rapidithrix thailandica]|uniref:T9SS type A sorting domain-containing protein n=1 Tax=Rapidithrix thailandica TaxID=413964 RepID=A0AAW9RVY2_9BACT
MIKYLLAICLFLWVTHQAASQSLEVLKFDEVITGEIGQMVSSKISLRNTSEKVIKLRVEKITDELLEGQEAYFKLGGKTTKAKYNFSVNTLQLKPGEVLDNFEAFFKVGIEEGETEVVYIFYDDDNPVDFARVNINYNIKADLSKDKLFVNNKIEISKIYPNPATSFAAFDYRLSDGGQKAKITIRNVLGSEIGVYELSPFENRVKFNLDTYNTGVYFYTLSLNDQTIVTRKFMVKK